MSSPPSRHDTAQKQNPSSAQNAIQTHQREEILAEMGNKSQEESQAIKNLQKSDFKSTQISSLHGDLQNQNSSKPLKTPPLTSGGQKETGTNFQGVQKPQVDHLPANKKKEKKQRVMKMESDSSSSSSSSSDDSQSESSSSESGALQVLRLNTSKQQQLKQLYNESRGGSPAQPNGKYDLTSEFNSDSKKQTKPLEAVTQDTKGFLSVPKRQSRMEGSELVQVKDTQMTSVESPKNLSIPKISENSLFSSKTNPPLIVPAGPVIQPPKPETVRKDLPKSSPESKPSSSQKTPPEDLSLTYSITGRPQRAKTLKPLKKTYEEEQANEIEAQNEKRAEKQQRRKQPKEPCDFLIRKILNPLIQEFDKIGVLRKQVGQCQVLLYQKDLKECGQEMENKIRKMNWYYDYSPDGQPVFLLDPNHYTDDSEEVKQLRKRDLEAILKEKGKQKSSYQNAPNWVLNIPENVVILEEVRRLSKEKQPLPVVEEEKLGDRDAKDMGSFNYKFRKELQNLDEVYQRAQSYYYHNLMDLLDDVKSIINQALFSRCKNTFAKKYLSHVYHLFGQKVKQLKQEYKEVWRLYYETKFQDNLMQYPACKAWYQDQGPKREYHIIDQHRLSLQAENEAEITIQKTQTQKAQAIKGCNGEFCSKQSDLGPYNLAQTKWQSQNTCRQRNVECTSLCKCDPNICKNRAISQGQNMKMKLEVKEEVSWGIDTATALNLIFLLPLDMPPIKKQEFIEHKLVFAVQQQGIDGYNIMKALDFIQVDMPRFTKQDKELALLIKKGIQMCKLKNKLFFRVHSKGLGIFCKKIGGIEKNSLVVEYIGEIYPQWLWYEKQDVLKQAQVKGVLSKDLPDFYNIQCERHEDDPTGFDIFTVDPILYGNYSSRLSHSCNPSCITANMVQTKKNEEFGRYSIGMYASRKIEYGEELTFNYYSFTESREEHESANCLCGTASCMGKFLQLQSPEKQNPIMVEEHDFLDRNFILYEACKNPFPKEHDIQILDEFNIKQSILNLKPNKRIPYWLTKWICLVCKYVKYEFQKLQEKKEIWLQKEKERNEKLLLSPNDPSLKVPAPFDLPDPKSLKDTRIQNICITVDKIKHVLRQMECEEPPLKCFSNKEMVELIWKDKDGVKNKVLKVIGFITDCEEKKQALERIRSFQPAEEDLDGVLKVFEDVSNILRKAPFQKKVCLPAFCDILYLQSQTRTYFSNNQNYKKVNGQVIKIRKCDVSSKDKVLTKEESEKTLHTGCKSYDLGYIWGQLICWFKQTVDKPDASLSADRRGTLTLPDMDTFINSQENLKLFYQGLKKQQKKGNVGKRQMNTIEDQTDEVYRGSTSSKRRVETEENKEFEISPELLKANNGQRAAVETFYPSPQHKDRKAFLVNASKDYFSRQWDVVCKWSFKNKLRIYGSCQFESVVRARRGQEEDKKAHFQKCMQHLLQFEY